jgi:serine/threonine protein kinase
VNLRIPVTLKVLNMRFFREESARKRFFREARVAVTVRHPNVASVYHLGMRGREMSRLKRAIRSPAGLIREWFPSDSKAGLLTGRRRNFQSVLPSNRRLDTQKA